MRYWIRNSFRHPLFPGLRIAAAAQANGRRYEALAGSFHQLEKAARGGAVARCAVFIAARGGERLPTDEQRDALWNLFQVPIYFVQLDDHGRVCAYECEARDGLHMAWAESGRVECGCGRPGLLSIGAATARPPSRAHRLVASVSSAA